MPRWPRVPKPGRTFADWFYTRGQQRRLRSHPVGKHSLGYVEQVGRMVYPPDMRREREALGAPEPDTDPPPRGRRRGRH